MGDNTCGGAVTQVKVVWSLVGVKKSVIAINYETD